MNRIDNMTQPCFDAILALRTTPPTTPAEVHTAYHALRLHIDTMIGRALAGGLGKDDVHDVTHAIVALADETALGAGGCVPQFWLPRLLQSHYFNQDDAGEVFFRRLERWRTMQPPRADILRVYYLCLALGFQGRYGHHGGGWELGQLMAALRPLVLAESTTDAKALPSTRRRLLPRARQLDSGWRRFLLPIAAAIASVALYYSLSLSLEHDAHMVATWVTSLITTNQ